MNLTALKVQEPITTENEVKLIGEAKEILAEAKTTKVENLEQLAYATDVVKLIGRMKKEAEADRLSLTGPLNSVLTNINSRFKKISIPLTDADDLLRNKIRIFQSAESRRQLEEAQKLRDEAAARARKDAAQLQKKGNDEAALEMHAHAESIEETQIVAPKQLISGSATGAKSTLTKRWKAKVIDIKKLAAARPELVLPNMADINRAVAEGAREIPGLEIYQEENVSIR